MNETETTLSQIATQISEAIKEKEAQKGEVEPAAIPALDRERLQSQVDSFAIEVIKEALNRYRLEPEESRIKTYVDWLIKRHAEFERIMQTDDTFRIRHFYI